VWATWDIRPVPTALVHSPTTALSVVGGAYANLTRVELQVVARPESHGDATRSRVATTSHRLRDPRT
jgi:hypothetical protein